MPKNIKEVLEALKYISSDRLKSVQRKLTSAKNTINEEALSHPFSVFLSEKERQTLKEATQILGSFKSKVKYAKEIRKNQENEFHLRIGKQKSERLKLLTQYLPEPDDLESCREAVLLDLAMIRHHSKISGGYYRELRYFKSALKIVMEEDNTSTLLDFARECWLETRSWLEEHLWQFDTEPEKERIEKVLVLFQDEWRPEVLTIYSSLIEDYDTAAAHEEVRISKEKRDSVAKALRGKFKIVDPNG